MNIEDQLCSLEQAKEFNSLGIKQGLSMFFYNSQTNEIEWNRNPGAGGGFTKAKSCFSMFNVAELGIMISKFEDLPRVAIAKKGHWRIYTDKMETYRTEAQARAAVVISAIKRKQTAFRIEYINKRLLSA